MTPDELLTEVRGLVGRDVAVAYHAGGLWSPTLHVQGRLEADWGNPETEFTIGHYRRGRRGFDYAAIDLTAANIRDAEWRDDVVPPAYRHNACLVITMQDDAVLTIVVS